MAQSGTKNSKWASGWKSQHVREDGQEVLICRRERGVWKMGWEKRRDRKNGN